MDSLVVIVGIAAVVGLFLLPIGLWRVALGFFSKENRGPQIRSGVTLLCLGAFMLAAPICTLDRGGGHQPGKLTACKSNLKNIGTAYEMYATDYDGVFPQSLSAITPNYLKTVPQCPAAQKRTYRVQIGLNAPMNTGGFADYYYAECHGENHKEVDVLGNYPAYSSILGLIERAPVTQEL